MDFSNHGALETMKWVLDQTPGTPPDFLFLQLHTGDPGAEGTANLAVENTREAVSFDTAINVSTDGRAQALTIGDVVWTAVTSTETYSHMSVWDAASAGNCWYKGAVVAPIAVTAGSNFKFDAGSKLDHV